MAPPPAAARFRRLLCPVDFSAPSRHALDTALALARAVGGKVTALHVLDAPDPLIEKREYLDWITQRYRSELASLMAQAACAELEPEALLREGSPAAEIVAHSQAGGVDLIVIGTHGRSGLAHLLLGSVAERVVRQATVPVLAVPAPPTGTAP